MTAKGQHVGIVAFGGTLTQAQLAAIVPGKTVNPGPPQNLTRLNNNFVTETHLDVEILFKCAPEAILTLYCFDETEIGWLSGLHGIVQSTPIPSILSISWGWPETGVDAAGPTKLWTTAAISAFEDLLAALTLLGVTIVVASGDLGQEIHYPASSAHVLSCGGTRFPAEGETAWSGAVGASGGGLSSIIPIPGWQARTTIACKGEGGAPTVGDFRHLPDVAALAVYDSALVDAIEGTSA